MPSHGDRAHDQQAAGPAVTGGQPQQAEQHQWPATAYVPIAAVSVEDEQATLELRHTTTGELALVCFSSVEQLVGSYGESQPWIAIDGEQLPTIVERTGAQLVTIDIAAAQPEEEEQ